MAAEIQDRFQILPTLIKGSSGAFEIRLNNALIFSKHELHRFPNPGEIASLLHAKQTSSSS